MRESTGLRLSRCLGLLGSFSSCLPGCVNDCYPEGDRGLERFLSHSRCAVDAAVFYFGPQ